MSLVATAWAMKETGLSPTSKFVLIVLADAHNGHSGECFPSIARIAETTGFSESTVKYAVRDLEEKGLLKRDIQHDPNGRTKGVNYVLTIPEPRGQEQTPRGHLTRGEGSSDEGGRGHLTPPHKEEPENRTGKRTKEERATRLPADWTAPTAFIDFAIDEGFTHDDITRRIEPTFRDHWIAASGASSRKADWFATWRNWVRRDAQRRPGAGPRQAHASGNQRSDGSLLGAYQRAAARVREADDVSERRAGLFGDGNGELEMRYGIPAQ